MQPNIADPKKSSDINLTKQIVAQIGDGDIPFRNSAEKEIERNESAQPPLDVDR